MMKNPGIDLAKVEGDAKKILQKFGSDVGKSEVEPVAFGLNALKIIFVWDESKGATDDLEGKLSKVKGVQSVTITDLRRAIG